MAIVVDAIPTLRGEPDAFDLFALPGPLTHLSIPREGEHLLLGQGPRSIHLSVATGTLLNGPVRLACHIRATGRLEVHLLALRRLAVFLRHHRMPAGLFPASAKARRWTEIIRAVDALALNDSHRRVAEAVFGDTLVNRDWTGGSDYLRTRTHRLVRQARTLVAGGYVDLLSR